VKIKEYFYTQGHSHIQTCKKKNMQKTMFLTFYLNVISRVIHMSSKSRNDTV